ncbi:MAG: hypothetical protein NT154_07200 [Verrucomicrobia bacterium]|nr:hypothetical protein [Verrucomicrobiota bacterium]
MTASAATQRYADLRRHSEDIDPASTDIYAPPKMQKMSKLVLALAEQVLVQSTEKSSLEAVAAALLLAHVAWNRAVDPLGGDQVGYYRKVLGALEAENPKCLRELKATDCEALIQDLVKIKAARYPTDDRIIRVCGITAENNVHVEWHHRGIEGTN